jgi:murein DD-endopeptidase MepM/ murein hydrolase activator NlpD
VQGNGEAVTLAARDGYTVADPPPIAAATAGMSQAGGSGAIRWPFPMTVRITDGFGSRTAPTAGASTNHQGVDFAPGAGTPIHVIADGVVRDVEPFDDGGLGVHVIVDHMIDGALVSSVYGHMQTGSIAVTEGQRIAVGDVLGKVGNTGVSTGAHLHLEIRPGGTDAVDPYAWLQAHVT